jgi:hypothetical protein
VLHGTSANIAFGARQEPGTHAAGNAIYEMSKRLLTFTESKKAKGAEAQAMISKAKRLVFLGFGFGEQNVELLRVPNSIVEDIRATVMGLSKSSQNEVLHRIRQITGIEFIGGLQSSDCSTLINDEQMFLTRSA